MMLGYPTKNCYIFKDILQDSIDAEVLKFRPEQKKMTANMTSFLQFGVQPPTPAGVAPIAKGELRWSIQIHTTSKRKVSYLFLLLKERSCGFILTSWRASSGLLLPTGNLGANQKLHLAMWCVRPPGK